MHPGVVAAQTPDKVAYVIAETGISVSFGELERRANQGAQLFRKLGLKRGDHIAILLENHPRFSRSSGQLSGQGFTTRRFPGDCNRRRWSTSSTIVRLGCSSPLCLARKSLIGCRAKCPLSRTRTCWMVSLQALNPGSQRLPRCLKNPSQIKRRVRQCSTPPARRGTPRV